jgi:hypothetical protein
VDAMDYRERNYYIIRFNDYKKQNQFINEIKNSIPSIIFRPSNDYYHSIGISLGFHPTAVISCRKEYISEFETKVKEYIPKYSIFNNCKILNKYMLGQ